MKSLGQGLPKGGGMRGRVTHDVTQASAARVNVQGREPEAASSCWCSDPAAGWRSGLWDLQVQGPHTT